MPTLYSKTNLSSSANGQSVVITATGVSGAGNLIHITDTGSNKIDELWLYGSNPTTQDTLLTLTIETGTPTGIVASGVVFNGVLEAYAGNVLLSPGLFLKGDGSSALSVYGWSSVSGAANIFGYVNRITES